METNPTPADLPDLRTQDPGSLVHEGVNISPLDAQIAAVEALAKLEERRVPLTARLLRALHGLGLLDLLGRQAVVDLLEQLATAPEQLDRLHTIVNRLEVLEQRVGADPAPQPRAGDQLLDRTPMPVPIGFPKLNRHHLEAY